MHGPGREPEASHVSNLDGQVGLGTAPRGHSMSAFSAHSSVFSLGLLTQFSSSALFLRGTDVTQGGNNAPIVSSAVTHYPLLLSHPGAARASSPLSAHSASALPGSSGKQCLAVSSPSRPAHLPAPSCLRPISVQEGGARSAQLGPWHRKKGQPLRFQATW